MYDEYSLHTTLTEASYDIGDEDEAEGQAYDIGTDAYTQSEHAEGP